MTSSSTPEIARRRGTAGRIYVMRRDGAILIVEGRHRRTYRQPLGLKLMKKVSRKTHLLVFRYIVQQLEASYDDGTTYVMEHGNGP